MKSPLAAIIGVIVVLIAVFVFLLPRLNTGVRVTTEAQQPVEQVAPDPAQEQLDQAQQELQETLNQDKSEKQLQDGATGQAVKNCIEAAGQDVDELKACQEQFLPAQK